jgi:SOS-response transcriptional repressor LexA
MSAREPLTQRQAQVLAALRAYVEKKKRAPSLRELGRLIDVTSTNAVTDHLAALERKGYIARDARISRSIVLVDPIASVPVGESTSDPATELQALRARVDRIAGHFRALHRRRARLDPEVAQILDDMKAALLG